MFQQIFTGWGLTLLLFFSFAVAGQVSGAELRSTNRSQRVHRETAKPPSESGRHWELGAAIYQGESTLSSPRTEGSGSVTQGMALVAHVSRSWILQAGVGAYTTSFSGGAAGGAGLSSGASLAAYGMTVNALSALVSPQLRLTDNLSFGPVAEMLFAGDVGFVPGPFDSGRSTAYLLGAQASYGFPLGPLAVRAGARYLRGLELAGGDLSTVQATLQLGYALR